MKIREYRVQTGLTLTKAARLLGWPKERLSRFETGVRVPGIQDIKDLQAFLKNYDIEVSMEELTA